MDARDLPRVQGAKPLRHPAADIPAEGSEAPVAQNPRHQLMPQLGDAAAGERPVRKLGSASSRPACSISTKLLGHPVETIGPVSGRNHRPSR